MSDEKNLEENERKRKAQTDNYVVEQLEDNDFEKEKAKMKEEKKAKKKEVKYDENGNPVKKKNSTAIIIIVLVVIVIAGIIGWFVTNLNKPENVVNDFAIYFNNQDWENLVDSVDMQGYLTLTLIEAEQEETTESDTEETEETEISYMDYDSKYETVYEDFQASEDYSAYYEDMMEIFENGEENYDEILSEYFVDSSMTINEIESVEKIENTKSLYKIKLTCDFVIGGEGFNDYDCTVYVSKVDGKYKVVGGYFAFMVFFAYSTAV